jgi:hypothetical protein
MISRRQFLGGLAALPLLTVLAGSGLRLPRRDGVEGTTDRTLTNSNDGAVQTDFSEKSLEDLLKQLRDTEVLSTFSVRPTKLTVHPHFAVRAREIIEYRPTFFERLWWNLTRAGA